MTKSTSESLPAPHRRGAAVRPRQLVAAGLVVIAAVFIAQNRDRVRIDLFSVNVSAPVWLLLTIMILIGMAVGYLLRARR